MIADPVPETTPPDDPFAGVPAQLRASLEKRGFTALTRVQSAVVAAINDTENGSRNLRISSQTGSGKTVALGLALAQRVCEDEAPDAGRAGGPAALVITPTRELAAQVQTELEWLFEARPDVRVDVVTGGTDVRREKQRLRVPARILVGTPGRLLDHIRSGALVTSSVREVVLDEADQMLDMGFKDELDQIVASLPSERRSHLVSATFPPEVEALARRFQGSALHVAGTELGRANSDIEHSAYLIRPKQRYAAVVNLLLDSWGERCLIFVRTRAETAELCEALAGDGFGALPFSGELAQAQRTRTLDAFRNGTINVLVATDVAARGIDVPGIGMVIHADIPKDADIYTHRSGRTGRAGKTGKSLIIVPVSAQARVHRMLRSAGIDARWEPVPTAKKILQGVTKATRRKLYERLEGAEYSESELTYAQNLLDKQTPAHVVAMLLRMAETPLPRAPMDVPTAEPRAWEPRPNASAGPSFAAGHAPPRSPRAGFVRFQLTWGQNHGANPSRCLSHVCRRGGIERNMIGAIDVGDESTSVEIAEEIAAEFEQRCRKPDPRDPKVRILREAPGSVPPRNAAARPARPRFAFHENRPPQGDLARPRGVGPRVKRAARRPRPIARPSEA
ncbi:MAG TPA: DEAD/DEAH box helicase [Polyangiaceae bacterium]|nr:DEAD/DEAH box helicase [Polyangiaceae bacterium]